MTTKEDQRYHTHPLGHLVYTEGVRRLVERSDAAWLLSDIAAHQITEKVRGVVYQTWRLAVRPDRTATLTMTDGITSASVVEQKYGYTDFGEAGCELFAVRYEGQPAILMLLDEY